MPFLAPIVASFTATVTSIAASLGFSAATSAAIASAVVQFGGSFILNAAANALFGKQPKAQDVSRELAQQTTEPAYRFVYGEFRATGTPVGVPVKDDYIYGAWLLNSRQSDLSDFTLYIDKREVKLIGDAFNLAGGGAIPTEKPFLDHLRVWVTRGTQISPPATFLSEAPFVEGTGEKYWKSTDGWNGQTIIWMRVRSGSASSFSDRWRSAPPLVEVEGKFSKVYDPRDPNQGPNAPPTWQWSDNHALCVRDALRLNPIRGYRESQLHDSFTTGADACDEPILRSDGETEPRYRCAGTLVFSEGEIEDQLNPMMVSGASDFIRIGGKLGYAAGVYRAPTMALDYLLGDGFEFPDLVPGSQLVNQLRVSYLSPERGYETAELRPWNIPNALAEDGYIPAVKTLELPFCPSPTQAMRVRKITGLRQRRQERIQGGELPPEAFDLVGGATVNIGLPSPYNALDGVYEVESIHPGLDPIGESGQVALRMPASLVKHDASIYTWSAAEEEAVFNETYLDLRKVTAPPGPISVTTGEAVNLVNGSSIAARIRFAFDPSTSVVSAYEWQYRAQGDTYTTGGFLDAEVEDAEGKVFGFLPGVAGVLYDIRVRAIGSSEPSEFTVLTGVTPVIDIIIDIPIEGSAAAFPGEVVIEFRAPNDPDFRAIEIFFSETDDVNTATALNPPVFTSPNLVVSVTQETVSPVKTYYYFARSRGDYGSASLFTASVSATTQL